MVLNVFVPARRLRRTRRAVQLTTIAVLLCMTGPVRAQSPLPTSQQPDSGSSARPRPGAPSRPGGSAAAADSARPDSTPRRAPSTATGTGAPGAKAQADTTGGAKKDGGFSPYLLVPFLGALGGLAVDLLADGGRLDRWRRDEGGWVLGFPAKMFVGAVAAVITQALSPASEPWRLIGTALAAGVGGEAILLAIANAKRADAAKKDAEQAREQTKQVNAVGKAELRQVEATAVAAHRAVAGAGAAGTHRLGVDGAPPLDGTADPRATFAAILAAQVAGGIAQLDAVAMPMTSD